MLASRSIDFRVLAEYDDLEKFSKGDPEIFAEVRMVASLLRVYNNALKNCMDYVLQLDLPGRPSRRVPEPQESEYIEEEEEE